MEDEIDRGPQTPVRVKPSMQRANHKCPALM